MIPFYDILEKTKFIEIKNTSVIIGKRVDDKMAVPGNLGSDGTALHLDCDSSYTTMLLSKLIELYLKKE